MTIVPTALTNASTMPESASGSDVPSSSDGSQSSDFTDILSDSVAQHSSPNAGKQDNPVLTDQQKRLIGLHDSGQELPLTGDNLPFGDMVSIGAELPDGLAIEPAPATVPSAEDASVILQPLPINPATASDTVADSPLMVSANSKSGGIGTIASPFQGTGEDRISPRTISVINHKGLPGAENGQALTPLQQANISAQGSAGEQSFNSQAETAQLTKLAEARMASAGDSPDFSRIIEKGLAQLNREMVSSTHTPFSEPASRTTLDGVRQSSESLLLQQPIDKPKWGQEFGSRLVWMSKEGIQNAQLRLTPAHLGTIEVKISIQNDQANISFMSQHGAVRDVIESSLPRLREMMQEAGVRLEQANVSSGDSNPNTQQREADKSPAQFAVDDHSTGGDDEDMVAATEIPRENESVLSAVDYYA